MQSFPAATPLFLSLLIVAITSLTTPATITPNNIYSSAGTFTFDTTPYYNNGPLPLNPLTFTLTFTARTEPCTNYHFGYSIAQFNYEFTSPSLNYSLLITGPKTSTSISAQWFTNNANKINLLVIRYIIIQPLFKIYYFNYLYIPVNTTLYYNTFYPHTVTGLGPFNTTGTLKFWRVYVGIDATLQANKDIDLYLNVLFPTDYTSIVIKASTIVASNFLLNSVTVGILIFNYDQLLAGPRTAKWTLDALTPTNGLSYTDTGNIVRNYNCIVGMISHHIINQTFFNQILTITPSTSITASTSQSYAYYQLGFIILQFAYCPPSTPYLMVSTNTCYDACPVRYYQNTTYNQCDACPTYDCYYCSANGLCSQCSSTVDFRTMNTTTNKCIPIDGYYDDGTHSQAVPCVASNCVTCTNSTFCLSCSSAKYLTVSNTCSNCLTDCLNCTSGNNCQLCISFYTFNNTSCIVDCSNTTQCLTCFLNISYVQCSSCQLGYTLQNNSCLSICGNGYILSGQQCDDNNTISGDGCSPTCTIQPSYFCLTNSTNGSLCQPCLPNCYNCTNSTSCIQCNSGYNYSNTNNTCYLNCNVISQCITCNYTTTINCITCDLGYYLNGSLCLGRCGDGKRVGGQMCDDGNNNSGDGCSGLCGLEDSYFCGDSAAIPPLSICSPCLSHCFTCTNSTQCVACVSLYSYIFNISYSCILTNPICGDGIISTTQICDDANIINGDGCSITCQVQPYFSCTSNATGTSVCSLSSMTADVMMIQKQANANSVVITYQLFPAGLTAYGSLDWATIVQQQSSLNINFNSFIYDASTGQLKVKIDYSQSITQQQLIINFILPNSAPFTLLPTITSAATLNQSNNLSLDYYSESTYFLAKIVEIIALALSMFSLLFFLLGYYSGKLIVLQCVTVFQLTYLSLLTLDNLSPTVASLRNLSYSCGFNIHVFSKTPINSRFTSLSFTVITLNNYNITFLVIIIPLLLSLILYLINRIEYQSDNIRLRYNSSKFLGQVTLYGFMFSAYLIFVCLGIAWTHLTTSTIINWLSLAFPTVLVIGLLVYLILLYKYSTLFGQFSESFIKQSCFSSFYCFIILQRVLTTCTLFLTSISPQICLILSLLTLQIVTIIIKKPYLRFNIRPIFNLTINFLTLLCMLIPSLIFPLNSQISLYAPILILMLLLVTLSYNIYYYIKQIKNNSERQLTQNMADDESKLINSERLKLQQLNSSFLKQNTPIITIQNRPFTQNHQIHQINDSVLMVKEELKKMKLQERQKDWHQTNQTTTKELRDEEEEGGKNQTEQI